MAREARRLDTAPARRVQRHAVIRLVVHPLQDVDLAVRGPGGARAEQPVRGPHPAPGRHVRHVQHEQPRVVRFARVQSHGGAFRGRGRGAVETEVDGVGGLGCGRDEGGGSGAGAVGEGYHPVGWVRSGEEVEGGEEVGGCVAVEGGVGRVGGEEEGGEGGEGLRDVHFVWLVVGGWLLGGVSGVCKTCCTLDYYFSLVFTCQKF